MKSPNAWIEVPELEFEISASGKRVIDTVYNHISGAIFELTRHAALVCDWYFEITAQASSRTSIDSSLRGCGTSRPQMCYCRCLNASRRKKSWRR
jgi:hypothetical protein